MLCAVRLGPMRLANGRMQSVWHVRSSPSVLFSLWQFAEMRDIFIAYDVEHSGELNRARFTEAFMAAGALLCMRPQAWCTACWRPNDLFAVN